MKQLITSFNLSIDGLQLSYVSNNIANNLKFDAPATCNLLQDLNAIEGFDFDKNGEPIILFTVDTDGIKSTGFCLWCDFVKSYPFGQRHAELLAEHHDSTKAHRKILHKINTLLTPAHSRQLVY